MEAQKHIAPIGIYYEWCGSEQGHAIPLQERKKQIIANNHKIILNNKIITNNSQ